MRALTFLEPGRLEWREHHDPQLHGDREALVRPLAASTCDLDRLLIRGEAPFQGPFAIGHECVAEIVDLGDAVRGLQLGQRVVVTWHISCGQCQSCRRGLTAHCEAVPYGAMYGLPVAGEWGGLFSDLVRVPYAEAMLVPVAADLPTAPLSSVGDNLALAHECLAAHLQARPGAITLILGSASVGLYAVQLAFALGAEHVLYVDADPAQRELAASLGAQTADALPSARDARFDLALDAAANEDWLRAAAGLLQPEGVLECPSIYFKKSVALPLFEMSIRGVTLHAGRGNAGPHIRPLLDLIAADAIEPDHICAETIPWDSAPEALADPSLKPVLVRD